MKSRWIQPDGTETIQHLRQEPTLRDMQDFVGGNIEIVNVLYLGKRCHMVVHEEGLIRELPKNLVATEIYYTASRQRGVEPLDPEQCKADTDSYLEGITAALGGPDSVQVTTLGDPTMENCIYGPAIVFEGKLQ